MWYQRWWKGLDVLIPLQADSLEPLYRQLRESIAVAIQEGRFAAGQMLPSSRGLAIELGVSRNTVNAAYQELVAEGFLESVPRAGYRVNPDLLDHLPWDDSTTGSANGFDWSNRLRTFQEDVGAIWKPADWHRYPFPFIVGQPDLAEFPSRAWNRALRLAVSEPHREMSLGDLVDRDDPLLVQMIRKHILPGRGITAAQDEILVTLGSQNGIFLVAEALLGPGTVAGVEEPGYPDARQILRRRGAQLKPLAVDGMGVVVPAGGLEGVSAAFVTPSHQYPTNVTMAVGRRHQLLAEAIRHDTVIIEDDYDSEFRYQGSPTPALKALDDNGHVVYLGSFSKFLGPGLRLGFVVGDRELIEHLRERRRYSLRHPPGLIQRTVALMIERGDYQRALRRSRKLLKAKWELMVEGVERHLGLRVEPTGGVSVWVAGREGLDSRQLADAAIAQGVVIEPGGACFLGRPAPQNFYRLGYSGIPIDRIDEGLRILAQVAEDAG